MTDKSPSTINSWHEFAKVVRKRKGKLLLTLPKYDNPILVTGCQRSGTTALTSLILDSPGIVDYRRSEDSELDGSLILCGHEKSHPQPGRYCFQTTYLNENYHEYFEHFGSIKMIFMIRNPLSVAYSMCYHWGRRLKLTNFALDELFLACGTKGLTRGEEIGLKLFGAWGVSRLRKACLSYVGKTSQLFELHKRAGEEMLVIDYDHLIKNTSVMVPMICSFAGLKPDDVNADLLHSESLNRSERLSRKAEKQVRDTCWESYERSRQLARSP